MNLDNLVIHHNNLLIKRDKREPSQMELTMYDPQIVTGHILKVGTGNYFFNKNDLTNKSERLYDEIHLVEGSKVWYYNSSARVINYKDESLEIVSENSIIMSECY